MEIHAPPPPARPPADNLSPLNCLWGVTLRVWFVWRKFVIYARKLQLLLQLLCQICLSKYGQIITRQCTMQQGVSTVKVIEGGD